MHIDLGNLQRTQEMSPRMKETEETLLRGEENKRTGFEKIEYDD